MFVDMSSKTTSNVSVNKHLQIVDAGAMEFLITIACADSLNVQRQALIPWEDYVSTMNIEHLLNNLESLIC